MTNTNIVDPLRNELTKWAQDDQGQLNGSLYETFDVRQSDLSICTILETRE
jgi:DNA polymerase sigma